MEIGNKRLMKASVYSKYGLPDVLEVSPVEKPIPRDHEVLIQVFATTVNRTDCAMLKAKPFIMRFLTGMFKPTNPILGTDFAGRIESIGNKVTSLAIGDRVFGFDDGGISSHAEYMTFPENKAIATIPENITFEEAAASIEGAHYAYNFINKVQIEQGQKIMVNGASGAIGSAAVQLLRHFGAQVTAVCNTKNLEMVKSLGAKRVIDYTKVDFTKDDHKYAFVFDTVGKSSFARTKPLLDPGGVYISSELGWMAQNLYFALITPLIGNKKVIFPIPSDVKGSVLLIRELMRQGTFKPVIDRNYSLEQIADAFKYVLTGQKTGNVVIIMDEYKNLDSQKAESSNL